MSSLQRCCHLLEKNGEIQIHVLHTAKRMSDCHILVNTEELDQRRLLTKTHVRTAVQPKDFCQKIKLQKSHFHQWTVQHKFRSHVGDADAYQAVLVLQPCTTSMSSHQCQVQLTMFELLSSGQARKKMPVAFPVNDVYGMWT